MRVNEASSQGSVAKQPDGAGRLAAVIYGGASLAAALIFWAITTFTGSYVAIARYGGAAWVFLLMMIVLMPIVIPRVNRRQRQRVGAGERSRAL